MLSIALFGPEHVNQIANAVIFSALGLVLLVGAFVAVDKATPYALWKEIVEGKNIALAILVGAMSIAMGLVIAAAIHG